MECELGMPWTARNFRNFSMLVLRLLTVGNMAMIYCVIHSASYIFISSKLRRKCSRPEESLKSSLEWNSKYKGMDI